MTSAPHRLRRVGGQQGATSRCTIACQATLSGSQEITVRALTPVSGPGGPQIGVRVGPILILLSDREALRSLVEAWSQAELLAETAIGPRF